MAIDFGKYGTPATTSKTVDFTKYGQVIGDAPQVQEEDGFFKSIYKSIASPVVNLLARPAQLVQHLAGDTQPIEGKIFGGLDVTDPYARGFSETYKDIGRGLETVALGIGGGGAKQTIASGIKAGAVQGLKTGASVGIKAGIPSGFGYSMEQGNTDIRTLLKDAAISGGVGSVLGGTLGAATGAIAGGVKKYSEQGLRDELGKIYRDSAAQYVKAQAVIDQAETVNKTDPISVLQMYGKNTIPEMAGNGADTINGQEFLKQKIGELSNIRNDVLFLSDERVPLQGYAKYANELLDAQNWSQTKKETVRKDLLKILQDTITAYENSPKNVGGIELNELNLIKTEQTGLSKSYLNKKPKFDYDAHGIAGKAARDLVELLTDDETVKDLNKLIQSHYDAIDLLRALNGKKVHGGSLSKLFFKLGGDVVGAVAGQAAGSPIAGALTGHVVAGKIADIVQSRFITNPMKRLLINNLKAQAPKEVEKALQKLNEEYGSLFQDLFPNSANMTSPITKPTMTAKTNAITPTIPPNLE